MPKKQARFYAFEVIVETVASEAVQYGLMEAGSVGTAIWWSGVDQEGIPRERIFGYFDVQPSEPHKVIRQYLVDALTIYNFETDVIKLSSWREVPVRDWLAEWKRNWQPVAVGCRFIIAPSWSDVGDTENRIVIRIEPGMAFGTGTHETTRLCLTAIERYFDGASFLDVGTGTGILAIAAALTNPAARIEACDTDAEAIEIARENARVNRVEDRIQFRVGTIDETTASADCVCANLTADVIVPLLPMLTGATCGRLILSGILTTQIETVQARLAELGANGCELMTDGEWSAIIV